MKNRKVSAFCNGLAMVCCVILVLSGFIDGKLLYIILYSIFFVLSAVSLILNIVAIKKEKDYDHTQI